MGSKKKGKKKSKAGNGPNKSLTTVSNNGSKVINANTLRNGNIASGNEQTARLSSPSPTSLSLQDDVSSLLVSPYDQSAPLSLPFIGPIAIAEQTQSSSPSSPSSSSSSSVILHGRGLVVTRDVSPGECLFVTPSIVSAPVKEVRRRFRSKCANCPMGSVVESSMSSSMGQLLEQITEEVLTEQIVSLAMDKNNEDQEDNADQKVSEKDKETARRLVNAFMAQMSSEKVPSPSLSPWRDVLLANASEDYSTCNGGREKPLEKESILAIVRRNAFGPDYHNYDAIARCWSAQHSNQSSSPDSCRSSSPDLAENSCEHESLGYTRLLGAYPLAAMINHSCCPNAVRVFGTLPPDAQVHPVQGTEVMIVHANAAIRKGTEITWSYLPPCTPYLPRREALRSKYGFECRCVRCINEMELLGELHEVGQQQRSNRGRWSALDECYTLYQQMPTSSSYNSLQLTQSLQLMETNLLPPLSNEAQRYLRVGYASIYMNHFNTTLSSHSMAHPPLSTPTIQSLLQSATQLHVSFVACNNASTEHLSILHLCYELASILHTRALASNANPNTLMQVRFWTEQLKKAHMVRYGSLGEELERVRLIMKHTRTVLRSRNGWDLAQYKFI